MSVLSTLFARSTRALGATIAVATTLGLAACSNDNASPAAAVLPDNPALTPSIRQAAFIFDVNRTTGKVKITAPSGQAINARLGGNGSLSFDGRPNTSIVAGDVVDLTTSGFAATGVGTGGCAALKVCVSFNVQITNKLTGVDLITPTWPTPPAGTTGALLFPFSTVTTTTLGGTATGGDGTTIIIDAPSNGSVVPNTDWDNTDWNFFNDTDCNAVAPVGAPTDCYRSEDFGTILAGSTTLGRRVGFTMDPTVSQFRVRALVVADLRPGTLALGSVAGNVSSTALGGPVSGVTVSVGSRSAISNALGNYQIDSITTGPKTVSVTGGLPAGCTASSVNVTIAQNTTSTANFPLAGCTVPSGIVTGQINSSLGGGINNVGVTVTPNTSGAPVTVSTGASGAFSASGVSVLGSNSGRITAFSNVPSNCTAPATGAGLFTYAGLTNGGTQAIAPITFTCTAPPPNTYVATWTAGSVAGEYYYNAAITLTAGQVMSGITVDIQYDPTKFTPAATSPNADILNGQLDTRSYNPNLTANKVRYILVGTTPTGPGANIALFRIKFTRIAAGTMSQITTINLANGAPPAGLDFKSAIAVIDNPNTLP
jgi:hypothetical protein